MVRNFMRVVLLALAAAMACAPAGAAEELAPTQGDFFLKDFHFRSGEALPELRLH